MSSPRATAASAKAPNAINANWPLARGLSRSSRPRAVRRAGRELPVPVSARNASRHGANSFVIPSQGRLEPGAARLAFTNNALDAAHHLLPAKLPRPARRPRRIRLTSAFGGLADC